MPRDLPAAPAQLPGPARAAAAGPAPRGSAFEGEDIFGDGVNVAARLEALAEPGGICISRVVRDQIRDKLPYSFEDWGEQSVKNIARPVRVYALRPESVADARDLACRSLDGVRRRLSLLP